MKILFLGTPKIAVFSLKKLVESNRFDIEVLTSCDKPKGRGYKLACSEVKEYALKNNLRIYQPENIKDTCFLKEISQKKFDLAVVVSFGQILPEEFINLPKHGSINVHFSLLPKYRGAAPVNWAIINGESKTGISIIYIEKELDKGDIILQKEESIKPDDDAEMLSLRLAEIGAIGLMDAIELIKLGKVNRIKQDETNTSYAPKIKREDTIINWNQTSRKIYNFIRGLSLEPGAFSYLDGKVVKIFKSEILEEGGKTTKEDGRILEYIQDKGWKISTKDGSILIKMIKPEGKRLMLVDDFMRGNQLLHETKLKGGAL